MAIPTPEEVATWNSVPELEPWEDATVLVWEALAEHPALKRLPIDERPTFWGTPEGYKLCAVDGSTEFGAEDPRWYVAVKNPLQARQMVDELVNGLRDRIRAGRRAGRRVAGG
jgi:hypothetical protein